MPNPPKPAELKRALGNPGKRALPKPAEYVEGGYVEPARPLEFAGKQLWDAAMTTGGNWIARHTDTQLLLLACEQMDRRSVLLDLWQQKPEEKNLLMRLIEIEKSIASNLSMLGFTPADRTRLGLAEVKARSKLEELMARKDKRVASTMADQSSPESD